MKKFITRLTFSLVLAVPFITTAASTDPTVSLKTTSLGYPSTQTFKVDVKFSEPVQGLNSSQVQVTNGSIYSITGSGTDYVMVIAPINPGKITITIPVNAVKSITNIPNQASRIVHITALDPLVKPSSNFKLDGWNLTLPVPLGNNSKAMMVKQPTLSGIPSENSGYTMSPYFHTEYATGGMKFFTPLNGGTTDNSDYPRTEFSEILNWKVDKFASNELIASVRVNQVPPSKEIVIGQIHHKAVRDAYGKSVSAKPLLKLTYDLNALDPNNEACNGCIYMQVRTIPGSNTFMKRVTLAKNIPLNEVFIYRVILLKDGTLTVKVNDTSSVAKISTSTNNTIGWGVQDLYFKAGVYIIGNGASNTSGGAVSFDSLETKHNNLPTTEEQLPGDVEGSTGSTQDEEIKLLKQQVMDLSSQNQILSATVNALPENIMTVIEEHKTFGNENIALKAESATLKAESAALKAENISLRNTIRNVHEITGSVAKTGISL